MNERQLDTNNDREDAQKIIIKLLPQKFRLGYHKYCLTHTRAILTRIETSQLICITNQLAGLHDCDIDLILVNNLYQNPKSG